MVYLLHRLYGVDAPVWPGYNLFSRPTLTVAILVHCCMRPSSSSVCDVMYGG